MSPEKPNVGKPVQQGRIFIIQQFSCTTRCQTSLPTHRKTSNTFLNPLYALLTSIIAWNPLCQREMLYVSLKPYALVYWSFVQPLWAFASLFQPLREWRRRFSLFAASVVSGGFLSLCVYLFCIDLPSLYSLLATSWLLLRPLIQFLTKPCSRN